MEGDAMLCVDPLSYQAMKNRVELSNTRIQQIRAQGVDALATQRTIQIFSHGNGFNSHSAHKSSSSSKRLARVVFEDSASTDCAMKLDYADLIISASQWNTNLLRSITKIPVFQIHEGVDTSLFSPSGSVRPKAPQLSSRFVIYSGGKAEFRKGQDLLIRAFAAFARDHRDALLVTNWHSPWNIHDQLLRPLLAAPLHKNAEGLPDFTRWALENGIAHDQFIDLGMFPNQLLPQVLRQVDVAVVASRAEACTSLVAKEAMACGVPVIASCHTGLVDLITQDNSYPLRTFKQVKPNEAYLGTQGWGEVDPEEIYEALCWCYDHPTEARALGLAGCQWIGSQGRTWANHAQQLSDLILNTGC